MRTPNPALAIIALVLAGGVTACGTTTGPPVSGTLTVNSRAPWDDALTPPPVAYSKSEKDFAARMIPHQEQAIRLARLAQGRSTNPGVLALAVNIVNTQSLEVMQLKQWVMESAPKVKGMGGPSANASGMAAENEMLVLDSLQGRAFDLVFLRTILTHHLRAIHMTRDMLATSTSGETRLLGDAIISGQTTEVGTIKSTLSNLI